MNRNKTLLTPLLLFFFQFVNAQNAPDGVSYFIQVADEDIQIDGKLDEAIWQKLPKAGGFYQTFPTDDQPAQDSTQFMITYTDKSIIVGIICWDYLDGEYISTTRSTSILTTTKRMGSPFKSLRIMFNVKVLFY